MEVERELLRVARKDMRRLLRMRKEFPWEPGILGEYMRRKCHEDIRHHIRTIRVLQKIS